MLTNSWYDVAINPRFIKQPIGANLIVAIKENRQGFARYSAPETPPLAPFSQLELIDSEPVEVWPKQLDFTVLLVKQVFRDDDHSIGIRYLITSDQTLTHDRTGTFFKER